MLRRFASLLIVAALVACGEAALAASVSESAPRPERIAARASAHAHDDAAPVVRTGVPAIPAPPAPAIALAVLGALVVATAPRPLATRLGVRTGLSRDGPRALLPAT